MKSKKRVALVHDYLAEYGGAERVLEALHDLFPEAPLYTAFVDQARLGSQWQNFRNWDIRTTWLTKIPGHKKLFSPLRIFAPSFFRSLDLSEFDLIISSTNAYFAKAITVPAKAKHICYCHTPSRSLWGYSTMSDWQSNPVTRIGGKLINHYLRIVDVEVARSNVDQFVANSLETARRINKFYKLDSVVIYPPVNLPLINQIKKQSAGQYYLYVNRLALAKHPEIAVETCTKLKLPLKVVGIGKMEAKLREVAGPTVEFMGFVPDEELGSLYQNAKALLYPVEDEDFGIVPVEAMGYGVPVIAHVSGGPLESIIDGETGLFFEDLTVKGLTDALSKFQQKQFSVRKIRQQAEKFDSNRFSKQMAKLVKQFY